MSTVFARAASDNVGSLKVLQRAGFVIVGTTFDSANSDQLMALPRLTYNGKYQDTPLLDLLLSGTLPRLRQGLRTRQRRRRSGFPTSGGVRIPD